MKYVKCAFVNSDDLPIKTEVINGYCVEEYFIEGVLTLNLFGFYMVEYPHPEAPDDARLTVTEKRSIFKVTPDDKLFLMVYSLLQSQKNMSQELGSKYSERK